MNLLPFSKFIVHGNSMLPTYKPGQQVLSFNWGYLFNKPKVGDIVVLEQGGKKMIKRVKKIRSDEIFVLGDNEKMSTDSRTFGWIKKSQIIGKNILTFNF